MGEELLPIGDKLAQSELTEIINDRKLSSRMVRNLVKNFGSKDSDENLLYRYTDKSDYERIVRVFDKVIIHLKLLIRKLASIIESVEDKWIIYDILMQHKQMVHDQIDLLVKERRKYKKYSRILLR